MDLEERVAELERRLAVLEERGGDGSSAGAVAGREADGGDFWALEGLKGRLAEGGAEAGGVLFTGAVRTPTGLRYEWQYGLTTDAVLDADWSAAAESFAALGQAVRLRLLREILDGRDTVAALTELDGIGTTGQIYHHLRQLSAAGWLHTPARGHYEIPAVRVVPLLVMLAAAQP
ncbi:winged helix-turn-helix domain-containing protein [Streptomyces varsoviensis]|uniref:winged helix-turn-helix domain-containing protein n=1 Tax=Streptomyces varsoviensis TaxID=67373 RepID=UPI0004CB6D57|nr:winged helix-turn-helix domain-containing protein [Streptomyces varsoviensis]